PRCLTPIPYRIHQDRFVPARSALEGTLFEARSLRRDACNPHVFAAYRTRTAFDWKLGLDGGLRCVHGYYPHVLPHQNIALRSEGKSVQYCAFELTVGWKSGVARELTTPELYPATHGGLGGWGLTGRRVNDAAALFVPN